MIELDAEFIDWLEQPVDFKMFRPFFDLFHLKGLFSYLIEPLKLCCYSFFPNEPHRRLVFHFLQILAEAIVVYFFPSLVANCSLL